MNTALYFEDVRNSPPSGNEVVFMNEKGIKLVRQFESPFLARKFLNSLRKSRKCVLISHTIKNT